jgi:hypothetical protein
VMVWPIEVPKLPPSLRSSAKIVHAMEALPCSQEAPRATGHGAVTLRYRNVLGLTVERCNICEQPIVTLLPFL